MRPVPGAGHLTRIGAALGWPRAGLRQELASLCAALETSNPEASAEVSRFLSEVAEFTDATLQETYTRTFDLTPQCAPYLGEHLFARQDARRSQLMIGLAEEYAKAGVPAGQELPDHVSVVLQALGKLSPEPARELAELCLIPALASMRKQLASSNNPFHHLISAASLMLGQSVVPAEALEVARG